MPLPTLCGQTAFLQTGTPLLWVYFSKDIMVLHAEVGDDALVPRVVMLKRPQTPSLAHIYPSVLALPGVVGTFADVVRRTHRLRVPSVLSLPQ